MEGSSSLWVNATHAVDSEAYTQYPGAEGYAVNIHHMRGGRTMRDLHGTTHRVLRLFAVLLLTVGTTVGAAYAARTTPALTADQATACIQAATTAQAGMVTKVEVEEKQGQRLCEVRIVDNSGKKHRLQVDANTHQVVKAK
jgi:hypothetical protein